MAAPEAPLAGKRVYLGDLPAGTTGDDINSLLDRYGPLEKIEIKEQKVAGRPPFAFAVFTKNEDAEAAVAALAGTQFNGATIKVEMSKERPLRDRDAPRADRGPGGDRRPRGRGGYRVRILNLPQDASWQDCKDFIRRAGVEIGHADLEDGGRSGFVELFSVRDVDHAIRTLDNTEFQGRMQAARGVVRVEEDRGYTAPPPSYGGRDDRGGYGGGYPPRDSGYGGSGGYGGGYGGSGGYGGGSSGYGYPPRDSGYGAPPRDSYGAPPRDSGYGGSYGSGGYNGGGYSGGGSRGGYGGGYGAPPAGGYDDRRGGYGGGDRGGYAPRSDDRRRDDRPRRDDDRRGGGRGGRSRSRDRAPAGGRGGRDDRDRERGDVRGEARGYDSGAAPVDARFSEGPSGGPSGHNGYDSAPQGGAPQGGYDHHQGGAPQDY